MSGRDPQELVKRLNTYADATTAFAILQTLAFLLALATPETRRSIIGLGKYAFVSIQVVAFIIFETILLLCYLGEDAIIGKLETRFDPIDRWTMYVRTFRIFLIFVAQVTNLVVYLYLFGPVHESQSPLL